MTTGFTWFLVVRQENKNETREMMGKLNVMFGGNCSGRMYYKAATNDL